MRLNKTMVMVAIALGMVASAKADDKGNGTPNPRACGSEQQCDLFISEAAS